MFLAQWMWFVVMWFIIGAYYRVNIVKVWLLLSWVCTYCQD